MGAAACACHCSCLWHPQYLFPHRTPRCAVWSLCLNPFFGPVSARLFPPPHNRIISSCRAPLHLLITSTSRCDWPPLASTATRPCLPLRAPPPSPLLPTMAARTAVVAVPTSLPTLPPAAGTGHGRESWTAAARSAVAAMWLPRSRGCWSGAQAGLSSLTSATPLWNGGAVDHGARLQTGAATRLATELAEARSAAADVAGAAVAIMLVLFCGLPEDEETPGGEPLKGGWWTTWGTPQRREAPAAGGAGAAGTAPPADWTVDPESDDPFHADLSPQWRWLLAVHLRVARAAVSAAQSQPAGERRRQPRMTRRPSMPSICEHSQLYEDQGDASQSAPGLACL